jgi:hypothetical protein
MSRIDRHKAEATVAHMNVRFGKQRLSVQAKFQEAVAQAAQYSPSCRLALVKPE